MSWTSIIAAKMKRSIQILIYCEGLLIGFADVWYVGYKRQRVAEENSQVFGLSKQKDKVAINQKEYALGRKT